MRKIILYTVIAVVLAIPAFSHGEPKETESEVLLSTISTPYRPKIASYLGVSITALDRFDIFVKVDPVGRTMRGNVQITMKNNSLTTLRDVNLKLWPNSFNPSGDSPMSVTGASAGSDILTVKMHSKSTAIVSLPRNCRPGESFSVNVEFDAVIPPIEDDQKNLSAQAVEQLLGMLTGKQNRPGQADYGVFGAGSNVINLGGFYPTPATLGKSGWEMEPEGGIGDFSYGLPSNYFVSVMVPDGYKVVAPGRKIKSLSKDGWETNLFVGAAMRDYVIEIGKRFTAERAFVGETTITAWFSPDDRARGLKMLQVAKDSFTYYSQKFGPYPWMELKVVEAPITGGAGGVEFPGLVTIADMLVETKKPAKAGNEEFFSFALAGKMMDDMLDFVVAHEVAHQWWNALVGSNPRKYPWIDEGLTSYSAAMYFSEIYGKARGEQMLKTQIKLNYEAMRLFGGSDRPVETPVSEYHSMFDYAGIVYGKAPLYHHALMSLVGLRQYQEGCREYARKYAFKSATPSSFTETMESVHPAYATRINEYYRRWMRETHGDEDIGKPDLGSLIEMMTGQHMDGNVKEFMEEMFPMMKQYK